MAGPTTEYLAEQIDRLRDQIGSMRDDIHAARREALDGSRHMGDIFASQLQEIRETMVDELTRIRNEVGAGKEALKVEYSQTREDLVALKAQTSSLVSRFDKTQDLLKQLLICILGSAITLISIGCGILWKASQAVHKIDEQGRRIEAIEKTGEGQAKLRESVDQLRKAIEARAPDSRPLVR